jgi:RNA polymerase sigma-70 factor, ECF subfamily
LVPEREEERVLLERVIEAWERVDVDGFVELPREGAVMAMPPEPMCWTAPRWVSSLATVPGKGGLTRIRRVPIRANLLPAYFDGRAYGIMVFEIEDGQLAQIVGFADAARSYDRFAAGARRLGPQPLQQPRVNFGDAQRCQGDVAVPV